MQLKKVIDGDTVRLETIDLGFSVQLRNKSVRINGIDTPESRINIKKYTRANKRKRTRITCQTEVERMVGG